MSTLTAIRAGLATNLATISGLRATATVPDTVNLPAVFVGDVVSVDYDLTMARGADTYNLAIYLLVSDSVQRTAQSKLDSYLVSSGASSIKQAAESDFTLGGACHSLRVRQARDYGPITVNDVVYLGVIFDVEIIA